MNTKNATIRKDSGDAQSSAELLKQALRKIRDLKAQVQELEQRGQAGDRRSEPLCIVGVGCRLPGGAEGPDAYWELLREGRDAITEVPPERWMVDAYFNPDPDAPGKTYSRWGGFVPGVDGFDAMLFDISPREAMAMDPQHRLLLEVTWEALENAFIPPRSLSGSRTGVFVGISNNDYTLLLTSIDVFTGAGNAMNFAAGRIAYVLGLQGPAMIVDTACSSSLVAFHLACQSLRDGECDMALACGVNLTLAPEPTIAISKGRMLSADGRCKTFDASADGYVRGEGCGVVVLKRLSDALAAGDRILAVVRGTAVNQDGPTSGPTVPNGRAQQALIRDALAMSKLDPLAVDYVEAHGTGTALGDPIEVRALDAALCAGRPADRPLVIGSVKTNIGHLESGAGIAGVIKVALALQHEEIPRQLHLKTLNPNIQLDGRIVIAERPRAWPRGDRPRIAGVSSFGFSGTNAHAILEEAPLPAPKEPPLRRSAHLVVLSATSEPALRQQARRLAAHLEAAPETPLPELGLTTLTGRSHLSHRVGVVAEDTAAARAALAAFAEGEDEAPGLTRGQTRAGRAPKVAFLFTGQGAQYVDMGRRLYETSPVFREAMDRCAEILRPHLERPLLSVIYPEPGADAGLLHETAYTQPAVVAIEYALATLWQSWGVTPAAVIGHSVGEYTAACVAGVLSLEDALKLIAARGRLMQSLPQGGAMAAIFAPAADVASAVAPHARSVSIAAVNGPEHTVISGPREAVAAIAEGFTTRGVKTRALQVSHAFHSPLMDPILDAFTAVARTIDHAAPRVRLASTLTGDFAGPKTIDADYWRRHLREAVRFSEGLRLLQEQGPYAFVEIGPRPVLAGLGSRLYPDAVWLASLREDRDDWVEISRSVLGLHVRGVKIDGAAYAGPYADGRVPLPSYAFSHRSYWANGRSPEEVSRARAALASGAAGQAASAAGAGAPGRPASERLLGFRLSTPLAQVQFESIIDFHTVAEIREHRIFGMVVTPGMVYAQMSIAAITEIYPDRDLAIQDVELSQPLIIEEGQRWRLQLTLDPAADAHGGIALKIFSYPVLDPARASDPAASEATWRLHYAASILPRTEPLTPPDPDPDLVARIQARCTERMTGEAFYRDIWRPEFELGPRFRLLDEVFRRDGEALGRVRAPDDVPGFDPAEPTLQPNYRVIDACIQLLMAALPREGAGDVVYIGTGQQSSRSFGDLSAGKVWSHVTLRPITDPSVVLGDVRIFDDQGRVLGELLGVSYSRVSLDTLRRYMQSTSTAQTPRPRLTREALLARDPSEQHAVLLDYIRATTARILQLKPEEIDPDTPITGMFDSLMTIELRNRIETDLKVSLPLSDMFQDLTIALICDRVRALLGAASAAPRGIAPVPRESRRAPDDPDQYLFPLSIAQRTWLFVHRVNGGSPISDASFAHRLRGALDVTALREAFAALVERHESLRTSFDAAGDEPVQRIHRRVEALVPVIDLTDRPAEERERAARQIAETEDLRPFDLTRPPLLRLVLIRLASDDHVLFMMASHIVFEAWSCVIMYRELGALYDAFAAKRAPALPPLSIQYADYAAWEHDRLGAAATSASDHPLAAQRAYWRAQLAGLEPLPALPPFTGLAAAPPPVLPGALHRTDGATHHTFYFPAQLAEDLKAFAQREGVTLFVAMLAAFGTLIHRYTGLVDLAIGSPFVRRSQESVEGLLGVFVNMLVLRLDLSGDIDFRALLERVRATTAGAHANPDVTLDQLLADVGPAPTASPRPLYRLAFQVVSFQTMERAHEGTERAPQSAPAPDTDAGERGDLPVLPLRPRFEGLSAHEFPYERDLGMVDLGCNVHDSSQGLGFTLMYRRDLFTAARILELCGRFQALLASVIDDPRRPLTRLGC